MANYSTVNLPKMHKLISEKGINTLTSGHVTDNVFQNPTLKSFHGGCQTGFGIVGAFFGTSIFWSPMATRARAALPGAAKRSASPACCRMSFTPAAIALSSPLYMSQHST